MQMPNGASTLSTTRARRVEPLRSTILKLAIKIFDAAGDSSE